MGIDTLYVGRLKGVGKVWQYTATDVASSYTFCWLTDGNDARRAAYFAELLMAHYLDLGVMLKGALTDNGPEYWAESSATE